MGKMPMYASEPTGDGRWYAVLVRKDGWATYRIPRFFDSKAEADAHAQREIGLSN